MKISRNTFLALLHYNFYLVIIKSWKLGNIDKRSPQVKGKKKHAHAPHLRLGHQWSTTLHLEISNYDFVRNFAAPIFFFVVIFKFAYVAQAYRMNVLYENACESVNGVCVEMLERK